MIEHLRHQHHHLTASEDYAIPMIWPRLKILGRAYFLFWLLFLPLIIFTSLVSAQKFAPVGSEWTYKTFGSIGLGYPIAYQFRGEKDTMVDGRASTIITQYSLYADGNWLKGNSEIVTSTPSGDTVSVYFDDAFHIIYDFTAEVGDTVIVTDKEFDGFYERSPNSQNRFIYKIDSIGYVDAQPEPLLMQYVSNLYPRNDTFPEWGFTDITDLNDSLPGRIVKGIGSLNRAAILGTSTDFGFFLDNVPGYLACYKDSTKYVTFSNVDCDSLTRLYVSTDQIESIKTIDIGIYPNPFTDYITIDYEGRERYFYSLSNLNGALIKRDQIQNKEKIGLSNLPPGIYHIQIIDIDRSRKSFLITKK